MPIPIDPDQDIEALAEAQLQEELRCIFVIDTEHYLQRYSQIASSLQTQSWGADIQELYRCIHTIKGGAVTVGYEAVLQVATALEEVLSHLRYLELAPLLTDGHLSQALLEAGELLSVTTEFQHIETKPLLNRIQALHQEIQECYLPLWDESSQLHQEFAEQGLDMVVLELEIVLEQLPIQGRVTDNAIHIAQHALKQLEQIGEELQFATGWTDLLQQGQSLFNHLENVIWQSHWSLFFQALKKCAKQSGKPVCFDLPSFDVFENLALAAPSPQGVETLTETLPQETPTFFEQGLDDFNQLDALAEIGAFLDAINLDQDSTIPQVDFCDVSSLVDSAPLIEVEQVAPFSSANDLIIPDQVEQVLADDLADNLTDIFLEFSQQQWEDIEEQKIGEDREFGVAELGHEICMGNPPLVAPNTDEVVTEALPLQANHTFIQQSREFLEVPPDVVATKPLQSEQLSRMVKTVQIPVPLEKLDQSAQYLVETILTLRSTQGSYQELQNQIAQLVILAQESIQAITQLRQLQDDYVLQDQLSNHTQISTGPAPERYRQGYAIINRLLENNLRLSEIGAETGKTSQQVGQFLRNVDQNVLKLQNTIEDSRLVPFQNVSVRAKAILRELTLRYGKPAQLVVEGEQTQLDVNTARDLEPALLHLIRNAYDHGLESGSERVTQGKPEQGKITLSLQRLGNVFQFELKDDGRGIDAQALQARAQTLGLPLISTQTPAEILAVICQPGFSSQTQVSEISGRGIGMDVVANQVAQLGGRLTMATVPGSGTTFYLKIPVPRLLVSCLLLRSGDFTFALPVDEIKTINLLSNLDVSPVKDSNQAFSYMIHDETGSRPALDLLKYWQPQSIAERSFTDTTVCIYIYGESSQQDLWFLADELLEQSDIMINPLPQPLVAPNGLIGVSLRANGTLLPVLEAGKLVERVLSLQVDAQIVPASACDLAETNLTRSILIVDDAVLMRRRLEASLNTYGYLTHTCADGQEAWNWLQTHPQPNLIITDIEMPKMDGFTLIDRCRQGGITVPILVISSRLSEDWFDEAKRLGANDYLTKGFATIDLIKKVGVLLSSVDI